MVHLGIIGTGGMANAQAKAFRKLKNVKLVAACDIDENRVSDFCKEHKIASAYTDVDKFLNHPKMDAVTNVTPDPFHAPISLKAIAKKKHILCEKPLAENASDATKMTRAAKRAGIINMVQFSYRRSAALQRAHKMITSGQLGRIVHFEARYYKSWISSNIWGDWRKTPAWLWRQSSKHGSKGVLGDVGVHIVDFA
ncbi:MAG: Gfo/Idh/MocA family oxidoreductase, partial [Verrucomicrobiota bacterium]